jgi:predicted N-acyltransferase
MHISTGEMFGACPGQQGSAYQHLVGQRHDDEPEAHSERRRAALRSEREQAATRATNRGGGGVVLFAGQQFRFCQRDKEKKDDAPFAWRTWFSIASNMMEKRVVLMIRRSARGRFS